MQRKTLSKTEHDTPAVEHAFASSTVVRAIDVLEAFTNGSSELSLKEISDITGLHKATALRLIRTLCHRGFINRHPVNGRYSLGFRLLSLAEIAKGQSPLVTQSLPTLRAVRDALNETIFLSVRVGDHRIDIEQVEGLQESRQVKLLGKENPLYAGAASKLLLAYMDDVAIDNYLKRTRLRPLSSGTITHPDELRKELARIRAQGYSESSDETNSGGASASAPIFGPADEPIATVTLTAPCIRFTAATRKKAITAVREAATTISRHLVGTGSSRRASP